MKLFYRDENLMDLRIMGNQHFTYWRGRGWLVQLHKGKAGITVGFIDLNPFAILTDSRGKDKCFNCVGVAT